MPSGNLIDRGPGKARNPWVSQRSSFTKTSGNVFTVKGQSGTSVLNIGATGGTAVVGASGGTIFTLTNSGAGDYMNVGNSNDFFVSK